MNYEEIKNTLDGILKGDVSIDLTERETRSVDWSLFKIMPDMVVYPKDATDLETLVDFVNTYNMSNEGNVWRAYGYPKNNEAIINLGL